MCFEKDVRRIERGKNMLKNNKGITMIALVTLVIVLLILTSITTFSGFNLIRTSKYYEAISEMKILQAKVNELYEDYRNAKTEEEKQTIIENNGEEISSKPRSDEANYAFKLVKSDNVMGQNLGTYNDYKYWSVDYIKDVLDIEGIKFDFIVNIKTRSVIMVDPAIKDGEEYHALCQIEDEQYNVDYNG